MKGKKHIGVKIFMWLLRPFQRLPLGFHYAFGDALAWIAKSLMHYRRDVILINLSRAFPEKKYKEISTLADKFYKHFGEILAESIYFGGFYHRPEALCKSGFCRADNPELLLDSFREGKSLMMLSSHYGNWEITGGSLEYIYKPGETDRPIKSEHIAVVYKKLKSNFWDWFIRENRCATHFDFEGYIESSSILRYAITNRHSQKVYVFPTDQHPYKGAPGCEIPSFMNQPSRAMTGGAALASKFGMPVFYMAFHKERRGQYRLHFEKICDDASTMTPQEIMIEYYRYLEIDVREHPENYLWSHKRWK